MLLQGQIALVTGASRGIGQAIALELGRQGAQVIGTATSNDGAGKIGQILKDNNLAGQGIVLDVNSTDSIAAALSELEKTNATPTILVNNAGITRDNLLLRMTEEEWDDQGLPARHDQGALGAHHQHQLGGGRDGQRRTG
jgi:3-oxoacyl-[acyl-carrier protein] reductase